MKESTLEFLKSEGAEAISDIIGLVAGVAAFLAEKDLLDECQKWIDENKNEITETLGLPTK